MMSKACVKGMLAVALVASSSCAAPRPDTHPATNRKGKAMATEVLRYGFRHDPMKWVGKDKSLQGALVRTVVFGKPKRGDKKLIQAEIDKILARQLPDGRLDGHPKHGYQFTAEKLIRLAGMGCPAGRAEVKKAVAAILTKPKPNQADPHGIYDVRAFCLLGLTDQPKFRERASAGLARVMAREGEWSDIYEGCPWTPIEHLITLWHGRGVAGTEPCVAKALKWIAEGLNDAGCISYKDPWGFVRLAGVVDHPLARTILEKELPVILRGQRSDGGWGDRSFFVFRALQKHGLLDPLRKRPPLPPDWRVVKTIPAPAADCSSLAWDGQRLWTRCRKTNEAVAVSPDDGTIVRRLKLPARGAFGIGTWDGDLAVTDKKAKKLLRIDAETGKVKRTIDLRKMEWVNGVTQVGGKLLVGDGFQGCVMIYDPAKPAKPQSRVLGGPIPVDLATDGAAVWHLDVWAPALIKSGLRKHGQLLDWGEKPFDGRCDGIAFDGRHLWALDRQGMRICALEKAAQPPRAKAPGPKAAKTSAPAPEAFAHGFRCDPMTYVAKGDTLEAALVRTVLFKKPKRGDKKLIQEEIEKLLAEKMEKPSFGDPPSRSLDLFQVACSTRKTQAVKVAKAILAKTRAGKDGKLGVYNLRAVCHAGLGSDPLARQAARELVEGVKTDKNLWHTCPWGMFLKARALWFARDLENVQPALDRLLAEFDKGMNAVGCLYDKDPMSLIDVTGLVEHPMLRKLLERQIPLVLRTQEADGGWGGRSFQVFRALMKHELLEPLRKAPPLPQDWTIARQIPAPADKLNSLAWDGKRLWTCRPESNEALALSPADGRVLKKLKLPKGKTFGVGWWDGALAVTQSKPKRLLQLDPQTGKVTRTISLEKVHGVGSVEPVNGRLWVCDDWFPCVWEIDPAKPDKPRYVGLGSPGPVRLCRQGKSVWHDDWMVPLLTRSDLKGKPIAWGTEPFPCRGLAWDGKNLWSLDGKAKRICIIEKAPSAPEAGGGAATVSGRPSAPKLEKKGDMACIRGLEKMDWGGSFFTRQESFMACFTEVLRCAGREATYAEVMGLSGAAFKLTTGEDNWCPSQAISDVGADCTARAARVLGFERDIIQLDEKQNPGGKAKARRAIVDSIDRGLPVLYMDGERSLVVGYRNGGRTFICKPYAGGKPGYVEMAALKGMLGDAWFVEVLRPKGKPVARRKALIDSLANAVALAKTPWAPGKLPLGLHAWSKWAEKLEKPSKDANLHGHAYGYSILLTSRQAAAAYLRRIASELKPECAKHLRTAAGHYEAIAKRLWDGRGLLKSPWKESWTKKNRAAEAQIFKECRRDELAAIRAIDQALQAEGINTAVAAAKTKMVPDAAHPQKLLEKAVAAFDHMLKHVASHEDWGEGLYPYPQPCVYLQMHLVEMQTAGWDIDFDTLVAVSGASALFAYQPKEFMPKYANLHIGMDRRIAEATGFGYEWVRFKNAEDAWRIIKETVDSGRVTKGWDWENCAFCGYQEAARKEDRKVFAIGDGPGTFSTWWTWKQFTEWLDRITKWKQNRLGRYTRRVRKVAAKKVALRVMQDLVAWSTDPPEVCRKHFPKATFGLAGIERYAADCADLKAFPEWGMCHDINPQWTVRHSTAVYVRRLAEAKVFAKKAAEHVAQAAAEYKAAAAAWHKTYGFLGHGATKEQRRSKKRREAGARLVREALAREKAGIAALRLALAAEGINVQPARTGAKEGSRPGPRRKGGKVWLEGVGRYRVIDPMFEGVRLILARRGESYSPEYVQGISGSAFRIGGICPCAPTCDNAMSPQELIRLLGYDLEHVKLTGKGTALAARTRKAVARVKKETDAGRAALVWHAFTNAEWDVVYGYDSKKRQFLGRGSYAGNDKPYATADEGRMSTCGPICDPVGVVLIDGKVRDFDARKAELAALREAVRHARSRRNVDKLKGKKWVMLQGIACYDRWIDEFKKDPKRKRTAGDAYCYGVYRSTHRAAAGFLREIAPKHPKGREHLKRAADHFEAEANALDKGEKLLWWSSPEGPDAKRNAKAAQILKQARDAYARGIAEIEKALAAEGERK